MTALGTTGRGRFAVQAWIASRLVLLTALLAQAVILGRTLPAMLSNWDVVHFVEIADQGYQIKNDVAFFPGLPLLFRAGMALGVPPVATGVVVSLVCSGLAAWALYRIAGPFAAAAWSFAPMAVFSFVPYTEAPFCAAAFWAWERAKAGRWWQAAALAGVASTFRVSGVFLTGALVLLALTTKADWRARLGRASTMLVPVAVTGAYVVYLYTLTGSWTAWLKAQADGWYRGFNWPWDTIGHTIASSMPWMYPDRPEWPWMFRAELLAVLVGVVVTIVLARRREWAMAAFVGVQVFAFSFSYWYLSVVRSMLIWFPVWIVLGAWIERRLSRRGGRRLLAVLWPLAALLMGGWAWLFFVGWWAG